MPDPATRQREGEMGAMIVQKAPCPFCIGYRDGLEGTAWDPSRREVETAHPEYTYCDVTRYLNGVLDATAGETFRINLDHSHCGRAAKDPQP